MFEPYIISKDIKTKVFVVIAGIDKGSDTDLAGVAETRCCLPRSLCTDDDRNHDGSYDCNNADDDQDLDERKCTLFQR